MRGPQEGLEGKVCPDVLPRRAAVLAGGAKAKGLLCHGVGRSEVVDVQLSWRCVPAVFFLDGS